MILTVVLRRLEHALLPGWRTLHSAPGVASANLVPNLAPERPLVDATERSWGHVPLAKLSVLFGVH